VSLESLVQRRFPERLRRRVADLDPVLDLDTDSERPAGLEEIASLPSGSMWVLEGGIAVAAILTALLIGIGR
jgi:hypothetical protein